MVPLATPHYMRSIPAISSRGERCLCLVTGKEISSRRSPLVSPLQIHVGPEPSRNTRFRPVLLMRSPSIHSCRSHGTRMSGLRTSPSLSQEFFDFRIQVPSDL